MLSTGDAVAGTSSTRGPLVTGTDDNFETKTEVR